jgi:DNA-binding NarL/FixJ family response regulator
MSYSLKGLLPTQERVFGRFFLQAVRDILSPFVRPVLVATRETRAVTRGRKVKLLIVDDSALVRMLLIDRLSEVGGIHIVGEASDAPEALDMIRRLKPEAVVLDFKMRNGNGLSVLRAMRDENLRALVMVLTNYPYSQYRDACIGAGAQYFFDKSTEFDKVTEVLELAVQASNRA